MNIETQFRAYLFSLKEGLTGNRMKNHLFDLEKMWAGKENTFDIQVTKIKRILTHAIKTVPFYSQLPHGSDLKSFPVVNKNIIRASLESFVSNEYSVKKLIRVTTSGSTGAPFSVYHDPGKRMRHSADNIFFNNKAGSPLGTRIYYMRVWNEINRKSLVTSFLQNIVMIDTSKLNDYNFDKFLSQLREDKGEKTILAFSSSLEALSLYILSTSPGKVCNVRSVIAISETLPEGSAKVLKEFFGCNIISRYSNIENGFLAQQCGDNSGEYHLNISSYFIELLDTEEDIPVAPGLPGRIVVTDLFNFGMPLIRYDTGDIGTLSEKKSCGLNTPVLSRIEGRKVDYIFSANGELISPHTITNTMWRYSSEIRQFQFIQTGRSSYNLVLNLSSPEFARLRDLINDLKTYVGNEGDISVTYTDSIPVLSSGKRKKILNLYKTQDEKNH